MGFPALAVSVFSPQPRTLAKVAVAAQVEPVMTGSTLAVITGAFRLVVEVDLEAVRRGLVVTWVVMAQVVQNGAAATGSAISRMRTGT